MSSKIVAKSFWTREVENELEERGVRSTWVFSKEKGELKGSEDDAMEYICRERSGEIYQHVCSSGCKKKGITFIGPIIGYYALHIVSTFVR